MSSEIIVIDRKSNPSTRWFTHLFLLLFFQTTFFFIIGFSLYAIITLNYQVLIVLVIFSVLQSFAKRSQLVIDLVNKFVKPTDYFNRFKRIYCEPIPEDKAALFCFHPHSVLAYCKNTLIFRFTSKHECRWKSNV